MVPRPPLPAPPARRHRPTVRTPRRLRTGVALAAAVLLAGCGTGGTGGADEQGAAVPTLPVGDALNLTRDCPRTITIQAGWFPTADVAVPFQLLAGDYRIDARRKRVAGSLVVDGQGHRSGPGVPVRRSGRRLPERTHPRVL